MAVLTEVVEGWSGALPFTLNADDVPIDLTGMTVQIILRTSRGVLVKDTSSGLTISSSESTAGRLSYSPATSSGNLFLVQHTPYQVRFRVTDALQKVVFFPNADPDLIKVNV